MHLDRNLEFLKGMLDSVTDPDRVYELTREVLKIVWDPNREDTVEMVQRIRNECVRLYGSERLIAYHTSVSEQRNND
jgi:hypothetical protein